MSFAHKPEMYVLTGAVKRLKRLKIHFQSTLIMFHFAGADPMRRAATC